MWDFIIEYWVGFLCGIVVVILTFIGNRIKKRVEKELQEEIAVENGLRAILHDTLFEKCNIYLLRGWINYDELDNVTQIYEAYHGLHGNGTGTAAFNDIKKLPKHKAEEKREDES